MKHLLLLALCAAAQDPNADHGVDPKRVDKAIDAGAEWLLKQKYEVWKYHDWGDCRHHDLVLYTLYHAGVDPQNKVYQELLKFILEAPLERTYCVSLQAMYLSEVDPVKYQWRLKQICQFLVDNQCKNGQWLYGKEVPLDKDMPTTGHGEGDDVATGGATTPPKPKAKPKKKGPLIQIKRRPKAVVVPETGDNSNTQYAVLGLRACIEANVMPPGETLKQVEDWLEKSQCKDGGWCYGDKDAAASYGSMTVGAVASLIIIKYYTKQNWKADKNIAEGFNWLIKNWDVKKNPGTKEGFIWLYYYLYAIERAGILSDMDKIGKLDWYKEGATFILDQQQSDGRWEEGSSYGGNIKDTCFAILFLRRATAPTVIDP